MANLKLVDKIEISGRVGYHEGARAYNTIRLPRKLIEQFPELKDKSLRISFKIRFYKDYGDLKRHVWEKEYSKDQTPLLLEVYIDK